MLCTSSPSAAVNSARVASTRTQESSAGAAATANPADATTLATPINTSDRKENELRFMKLLLAGQHSTDVIFRTIVDSTVPDKSPLGGASPCRFIPYKAIREKRTKPDIASENRPEPPPDQRSISLIIKKVSMRPSQTGHLAPGRRFDAA